MSLEEVDVGVTALLLTQGVTSAAGAPDFNTHLFVGRLTKLTTVTTSTATNNAITLPIQPIIGAEYQVSVSAACAAPVAVFPAQGTASGATATINGQAINTAVLIGLGGSAKFICTANVAGTGATWFAVISNPPVPLVVSGIKVAPYTVTPADHGACIRMTGTLADFATLPPVAASSGFQITFVLAAAGAGTVTPINSNGAEGAIIVGYVTPAPGTAPIVTAGCTHVNWTATVGLGDIVYLTCNGTNWFVTGYCEAAAGISFT